MHKIIFITALFLAGCHHNKPIRINPAHIDSHLGRHIESIIAQTDPQVNIGVKIVSLHNNKTIFDKNSGRHFIPASTTKLITLAAALYYLGPHYRFATKIFSEQTIDDQGHLKNLYIEGSGDPGLMDTNVTAIIHELKQMGLTSIDHDIYIDDSIFDDALWGPGVMWDDRNRGFAAPIAGLNMNFNRLLVKIAPSIEGKSAYTILSPFTSFIEARGNVITKRGSAKQITLTVEQDHIKHNNWPKDPKDGLHKGDKIFLSGHLGKNADPHYLTLAINDPGMFVGNFIKEQLKHMGINFHGKIVRKVKPNNAVELTHHLSPPLSQYLIDFTKISNNLANDVLIKAIASNSNVKPATFSAGLKLVRDFLKSEIGILENSLITVDGAGLSNYNLITPDHLVKILVYASNHFHLGPEYMSALPIGGKDGTLRQRLLGDEIQKNVRAKTGSHTGVSCMAGYFTGADQNRYAFAIMINNFIGPAAKYTRMQDQILTSMIAPESTLAKIRAVKDL